MCVSLFLVTVSRADAQGRSLCRDDSVALTTLQSRVQGAVDWVLGSDIIFDRDANPSLSRAIRSLAGANTLVVLIFRLRHYEE